jgi:hypothetical protein
LYLALQSNTIIYPYTCSLTLVVQPTAGHEDRNQTLRTQWLLYHG